MATYTVRESFLPNAPGPILGSAPTVAEAFALIPGNLICAEEDAENPGYGDAFNDRGQLFVIEPAQEA